MSVIRADPHRCPDFDGWFDVTGVTLSPTKPCSAKSLNCEPTPPMGMRWAGVRVRRTHKKGNRSMATKLREADFAQTAAGDDLAGVRSYWPYASRARYIFRDLSMKLESGLQFFHNDPVFAQPAPSGGVEAVVAGLPNPPPPALAATTDEATFRESPLDINIHGDPAFVVLRVDPSLNWRFDWDEAALSLKNNSVVQNSTRAMSGGTYLPIIIDLDVCNPEGSES